MGNINLARVLLGGLAAGVVGNVLGFGYQLVFGERMVAALANLGVEPPGSGLIVIFVLLGFVSAIVTIWLYAAVRPRLGAGPGTAVIIAIPVWILASLIPSIAFSLLGLFAASDMAVGTVFDLIMICIATVAGAWVYREGPAAGS